MNRSMIDIVLEMPIVAFNDLFSNRVQCRVLPLVSIEDSSTSSAQIGGLLNRVIMIALSTHITTHITPTIGRVPCREAWSRRQR